jgi:hypothetical protein
MSENFEKEFERAALKKAAEEALKVRHLSELSEYATRGTSGLNQFGWSRLYRILVKLLPFTALANPGVVLELLAENDAQRDEIARLCAMCESMDEWLTLVAKCPKSRKSP